MSLYTLYIVNKAGGLIYNRDLSPVPKLGGNEYLTLASTFHSLHAIAKQLSPVQSGGINSVESVNFTLSCFESPTGIKFFVTSKPKTPDVNGFLKKVYEYYADFVLKNPFYEIDMPIRIRLFDYSIETYVKNAVLGNPPVR
jgi:trafficking protein particle complex subunit 4